MVDYTECAEEYKEDSANVYTYILCHLVLDRLAGAKKRCLQRFCVTKREMYYLYTKSQDNKTTATQMMFIVKDNFARLRDSAILTLLIFNSSYVGALMHVSDSVLYIDFDQII